MFGHPIDGSSIVEVIENADAVSPHERFYWQLGGNPDKAKWVVREGAWKLLGNASESVRPEGVPELTKEDRKLFLANLAEDIGETRNVADAHPDIVQRLLDYRKEYVADIQKSLAEEAADK